MPYIPEELQTKITLMAYGLSPHPLATLIKESITYKHCSATLCVLNYYDFLDDLPHKYLKDRDMEEYTNIEIEFMPKSDCDCIKARFFFEFETETHRYEMSESRMWKKNTLFDRYVTYLIKDVSGYWDLKHN